MITKDCHHLPSAPQFLNKPTGYNLGVFRGYNNLNFLTDPETDGHTAYQQGERHGIALRKEAELVLLLIIGDDQC